MFAIPEVTVDDRPPEGLIGTFYYHFERHMVWITLISFIIGVFLGLSSDWAGDQVNALGETFIDSYSVIAPVAIFLILAPALCKIFTASKMGRYGAYVIYWLGVRKLLACLWAAIFTTIAFDFTLLPPGAASLSDALTQTGRAMQRVGLFNPYFIAIYVSVGAGVAAIWVRPLRNLLNGGIEFIELLGKFFEALVPLFLVAVGAYVATLSSHIKVNTDTGKLVPLNFFGVTIDPATASGTIGVYLVGSLIVFVGCIIWQFSLLWICKMKVPQFSIISYFRDYWLRVYPLLFATSSEAIATPLNLYLTKRFAPWVREMPRRLVIGMGSFLNINGTLMCVYVFVGLVAALMGLPLSLLELLALTPVIFLISYAVPGIPGELVLFAGPILMIMGLSPEASATFLALYVGLQLGLPDSVRTGNNSTDDFLCAVLLNEYYIKNIESKQIAEGTLEEAEGVAAPAPARAFRQHGRQRWGSSRRGVGQVASSAGREAGQRSWPPGTRRKAARLLDALQEETLIYQFVEETIVDIEASRKREAFRGKGRRGNGDRLDPNNPSETTDSVGSRRKE